MKLLKTFTRPFTDSAGNLYPAFLNDGLLCHMPDSNIYSGLALTDPLDGKTYLVKSCAPVAWKNKTAYFESEIRQTNSTVTISRFTQGNKNAFGRPADPAPAIIAADVPAFIETSATLRTVQTNEPDGTHDARKLRALVQVIDARVGDRVTTAQAETFMVQAVDLYSNPGLLLLHLSPDNR
jgi:hypothetical protein